MINDYLHGELTEITFGNNKTKIRKDQVIYVYLVPLKSEPTDLFKAKMSYERIITFKPLVEYELLVKENYEIL